MQHSNKVSTHQLTIHGIYWAFAGVAALATWQLQPIKGAAATTTPQASTTSVSSGATDNKTVPLKSTNETTTSTDTTSAKSETTDPKSTAPTPESNTPVASSSTAPTNGSEATPTSNKPASETDKSEAAEPNTQKEPTTAQSAAPVSTAPADNDVTSRAPMPAMRRYAAPEAVSLDDVEAPVTDIASSAADDPVGTTWRIDSKGTLHLAAGTLNSTNNTDNWSGDSDKINKISFDGAVTTGENADLSSLFSGLDQVTQIDNLQALDTSNVVNMASMFQGMSALTSIDLSHFDTSKVTDMSDMFSYASSLKTLDVSHFVTDKVTNMVEMFSGLFSLTSLDVSNLDTSQVTDMRNMFNSQSVYFPNDSSINSDTHLKELILPTFDLSHVTNMASMFSGLNAVKDLKLTSENHGTQVIDMDAMFMANGGLVDSSTGTTTGGLGTLDLSGFQIYSTDNTQDMLSEANKLSEITLGKNNNLSPNTGLAGSSMNDDSLDQWVAVDEPAKKYSTAELVALYGKDNQAETETYRHTHMLTAHDTTLIAGKTTQWKPADNITFLDEFAQETSVDALKVGSDGLAVTVVSPATLTATVTNAKDNTTVTSIDTTKPGTYTVNYQIEGFFGGTLANVTATVNVQKSKADINVTPDESFFAGNNHQDLDALSKVTKVVDATGQDVPTDTVTYTVTKDGTPLEAQTGNLTTTPGSYQVDYHYTDSVGNNVVRSYHLVITASKAKLTPKPAKIYAGNHATWQPSMDFVSGTDEDGKDLTLDNPNLTVTVTRNQLSRSLLRGMTVDTQRPGSYQVTYTYTDVDGNTTTATTSLTVEASPANLAVKPASMAYLSASRPQFWQAKDSFLSGVTVADQPVALAALTITFDGKAVQPTTLVPLTAGQHTIVYQYTDPDGNTKMAKTTITALASKANIDLNAPALTIMAGDNWSPLSNFATGTDATGKPLAAKDVTVTYTKDGQAVEKPDLSQAGTYQLTYHYTDTDGNSVDKTTTLTVKAAPVTQPDNPGTTTSVTPTSDANVTDIDQPTAKPKPTKSVKPVAKATNKHQTSTATGKQSRSKTNATTTLAKTANKVNKPELKPVTVKQLVASKATQLPQTNEQNSFKLSLLGLVLGLLTSIIGFSWFYRK